jgi:hypothetical protein
MSNARLASDPPREYKASPRRPKSRQEVCMAVEYLEITQVLYFILEVLRGASILRVFLRNTRRLVIFFYQLLQESFLLKNHKNIPSFEFLIFRAKL